MNYFVYLLVYHLPKTRSNEHLKKNSEEPCSMLALMLILMARHKL